MIKKIFLICFVFFTFFARANQKDGDFSIIFFYKGEILPDYIFYEIYQTRLFNKTCPIFLIANLDVYKKSKLSKIKNLNITFIDCQKLRKNKKHVKFNKICKARGVKNYYTERFFYIEALMKKYNLKHVFHIECDVMLYVDLSTLLPVFKKYYPGIAAVFQNDILGSVGFLYFASYKSIAKFTQFIVTSYTALMCNYIDMYLLGGYRCITDQYDVDHLPMVPKEYTNKKMCSKIGESTRTPELYCNHIEEFNSLFDADYLGIHLNKKHPLGDMARQVLYNADDFSFIWKKDEEGRSIPYMIYENKSYRINTLHVYHKNLRDFVSLVPQKNSNST